MCVCECASIKAMMNKRLSGWWTSLAGGADWNTSSVGAWPINLMETETKRARERGKSSRPQTAGVMKGPGPPHLSAVLPCWDALLPCPAQTLPSWDWPVNNGPVISLGRRCRTAEGCVWPHVCVWPCAYACLPVQSFTLTVPLSCLVENWCIHIE